MYRISLCLYILSVAALNLGNPTYNLKWSSPETCLPPQLLFVRTWPEPLIDWAPLCQCTSEGSIQNSTPTYPPSEKYGKVGRFCKQFWLCSRSSPFLLYHKLAEFVYGFGRDGTQMYTRDASALKESAGTVPSLRIVMISSLWAPGLR